MSNKFKVGDRVVLMDSSRIVIGLEKGSKATVVQVMNETNKISIMFDDDERVWNANAKRFQHEEVLYSKLWKVLS